MEFKTNRVDETNIVIVATLKRTLKKFDGLLNKLLKLYEYSRIGKRKSSCCSCKQRRYAEINFRRCWKVKLFEMFLNSGLKINIKMKI